MKKLEDIRRKTKGTLDQDLEQWEDELFTKEDLKAGLNLLFEITGGAGLAIGGIVLASNVVPFLNSLGIPITMGAAHIVLKLASDAYGELGTEERKAIRAVTSFVRGGFSLSCFVD